MSSSITQRGEYPSTGGRQNALAGIGTNPYTSRRPTKPLQFGLTMVLLASLLLLGMAGITRYTVGEPLMPDWFAKAIHHKQPALPPGMTFDFEILDYFGCVLSFGHLHNALHDIVSIVVTHKTR